MDIEEEFKKHVTTVLDDNIMAGAIHFETVVGTKRLKVTIEALDNNYRP